MKDYRKTIKILIPILLVIGFWIIPNPQGVTVGSWHTLAIFLGFMVGCILNVAPLSVLSLISVAVLTITKTISPEIMFSGFGLPIIWLIMSAFFLAIGFRVTNLGNRLAYYLIYKFGKSPITLAYTLTFCDILIAPFVPNTNARGAGIMYPITLSLSKALNSDPKDGTERKIGSYLLLSSFHQNLLAGGLFLTAMATNPIAVQMASDSYKVSISWTQWLLYSSVPTILALIVTPLVIYKVHTPELKKIPNASKFAKDNLEALGKISRNEIIMLLTFLLMIILWATATYTQLDNGVIAMLGVVILLITGVIKLDDVLSEKKVWNIFLWLAPVMTMTSFMVKGHIIDWFQAVITKNISGFSLPIVFVILVLVYYYIHYFLTSVLVHMQAFLLPFAAVLVSMGMSPTIAIMLFALLTCFSPATTHYGTGTASIYFATGYVTQKEWWKVGFILSVILVLIYSVIGLGWWTLLGI